jgi:predicted Fe-S protein YdhL (DUF1289 family)
MNPPQTFQQIESPCIKVCEVDANAGVCTGCHRTLNEIASWSSFTNAERRTSRDHAGAACARIEKHQYETRVIARLWVANSP